MTPDQIVKYGAGTLLVVMFGFLAIIAVGLALESAWHWIQAIVLRWRAWRGFDPDDKDHA